MNASGGAIGSPAQCRVKLNMIQLSANMRGMREIYLHFEDRQCQTLGELNYFTNLEESNPSLDKDKGLV